MAVCQFCGLGRVCSWGWNMLVADDVLSVVTHVLSVLEFLGLYNLCIIYA